MRKRGDVLISYIGQFLIRLYTSASVHLHYNNNNFNTSMYIKKGINVDSELLNYC